jgi:hypothetical protein
MKTFFTAAVLTIGLMGLSATAAGADPMGGGMGGGMSGHHHHHRHCVSWGWHHHHHGRYCRRWGW